MLTVLFATYNGGKTLPVVLEAYRNLEVPAGEWKLVIVDNGSNDGTGEIIESYRHLLPVTPVREVRRGKNIALNTGLSEVKGDLVVLTDDDVIPQENWLSEFKVASELHPECAIFGGPILPKWEICPEDWILSWVPLEPTYGLLNGKEEGPISYHVVFGGNMAIRSKIFEMGYRFNESVGPRGASYAQGSETELLMRLDRAGFKAWHCKDAVVEHMIKSSQMEREWVLARAKRYGRGRYRLRAEQGKAKVYFWKKPRPLFLRIVKNAYLLGKANLIGNAESVFKESWDLNYLLGAASEARQIRKERRKDRAGKTLKCRDRSHTTFGLGDSGE
jgi:L-malate glycosyltransferase